MPKVAAEQATAFALVDLTVCTVAIVTAAHDTTAVRATFIAIPNAVRTGRARVTRSTAFAAPGGAVDKVFFALVNLAVVAAARHTITVRTTTVRTRFIPVPQAVGTGGTVAARSSALVVFAHTTRLIATVGVRTSFAKVVFTGQVVLLDVEVTQFLFVNFVEGIHAAGEGRAVGVVFLTLVNLTVGTRTGGALDEGEQFEVVVSPSTVGAFFVTIPFTV